MLPDPCNSAFWFSDLRDEHLNALLTFSHPSHNRNLHAHTIVFPLIRLVFLHSWHHPTECLLRITITISLRLEGARDRQSQVLLGKTSCLFSSTMMEMVAVRSSRRRHPGGIAAKTVLEAKGRGNLFVRHASSVFTPDQICRK